MEEIIRQLLDRVANLELALREMQAKEEKQKKNESSPCTPLKKEKEEKEENTHTKRIRVKKKFFTTPTAEEVQQFLNEMGEKRFTGQHFVDYYDAVDWVMTGGRHMKDWKSVVKIWMTYPQRQKRAKPATQPTATPQFHETEELLRKREAEEASAVSYQEYLRQKQAGIIGKGGQR